VLVAALRVALVAISLALDVFAVSVGVGIRGVTRGAIVRIGASFAAAEVTMNLVGAGLGVVAGHAIGGIAAYIGFFALFGVGVYMVVESIREGEKEGFDLSHGWGLFVASLSISLDSLGIGFSIVYIGVPLGVTLAAIALASVISTLTGLAFGRRLGARVGERAGVIAGIVLMLTGIGFALLKYFNIG
jgi:putative Mn2+ efflux pump MntP